ncbi:hypothetical protein COO60DRAFT_1213644 [Scenedesmus sp. NREL 46B-D3]|nr:hypothetical protein COO60DRAFT_1213644 [Scenedesmus sp. NREL 46B-D3]
MLAAFECFELCHCPIIIIIIIIILPIQAIASAPSAPPLPHSNKACQVCTLNCRAVPRNMRRFHNPCLQVVLCRRLLQRQHTIFPGPDPGQCVSACHSMRTAKAMSQAGESPDVPQRLAQLHRSQPHSESFVIYLQRGCNPGSQPGLCLLTQRQLERQPLAAARF